MGNPELKALDLCVNLAGSILLRQAHVQSNWWFGSERLYDLSVFVFAGWLSWLPLSDGFRRMRLAALPERSVVSFSTLQESMMKC